MTKGSVTKSIDTCYSKKIKSWTSIECGVGNVIMAKKKAKKLSARRITIRSPKMLRKKSIKRKKRYEIENRRN
jgi:hypothetical protein